MVDEIKPFDIRDIQVSALHSLHVEQFGNPDGYPVVYLHGGPGAGCSYQEYRLFNPDVFRVVLFDQRGCGRSQPYAEIREQGLDALVSDLDEIRSDLDIDRWGVVGGSWGSVYALLYAKAFPERVDRILLRGFWYGDRSGALNISEESELRLKAPEQWALYSEWDKAAGFPSLIDAYNNLANSADMDVALEAARRFMLWDTAIATPKPRQDLLDEVNDDLHGQLAITRLWFHYAKNEFLKRDGSDFLDVESFRRTPIDLVQGAKDYICPPTRAREFCGHYPHVRYYELADGGHSMADEPVRDKVVQIIGKWERALTL